MSGTGTHELTKNQQRYFNMLRFRSRIADLAARLRAVGIQLNWLAILIAGAAIPLIKALDIDEAEWVIPSLGFVVVVAAGLERIFARTTEAATAVEELRRRLARERRLLLAESEEYAASEDRFATFVKRSEEAIAKYDSIMVKYDAKIVDTSK